MGVGYFSIAMAQYLHQGFQSCAYESTMDVLQETLDRFQLSLDPLTFNCCTVVRFALSTHYVLQNLT